MKVFSLVLTAHLNNARDLGCDPGDLWLHHRTDDCKRVKNWVLDDSGNVFIGRGSYCKFQLKCHFFEGPKTEYIKCRCKKGKCSYFVKPTLPLWEYPAERLTEDGWVRVEEGTWWLYENGVFPDRVSHLAIL